MDTRDLQAYLHRQIPLSAAMKVAVRAVAPDSVQLSAPFAPNINHKSTVFGGSASALSILAAWALVHVRLMEEGLSCEVVIQSNHMDYERPLTGEFVATSSLEDEADWPAFVRLLARKRRARIAVQSVLTGDGIPAGRLRGKFVAFLGEPPQLGNG